MIDSPLVVQCCDRCGRGMLKAHRVYRGERFCSTCYPKVFERRKCPVCEHFARLPKSDLSAICKTCATDIPCTRCGKTVYDIGKITPYGPVCNSCSVYFRAPRAAATTPPISTIFVKSPSDTLTVASRARVTCRSCRRHRIVASYINGVPLCKACSESGPIPCPSCGCEMPAGRGKRCEDCYWKDTLFRRVILDEAGFSTTKMAVLFREFGIWLVTKVPAQKAALSIHRYFPFFYEIDKKWGSIPSYEKLVGHFDAEGLRRVRLPMRWLAETLRVAVDANQREEASEQRRIEALVLSLPPSPLSMKILAGYIEVLLCRMATGKTTLRSIRLSLTPAVRLLAECEADGFSVPGQLSLNRYLAKVPGQRASLTGFVSFINEHYGANVSIARDNKQAGAIRKKKLEADLTALLSEASTDPQFQRRWLSVALAYFHGLSLSVGKCVKDSKISVLSDGNFNVTVEGNEYWVPRWDFHAGDTVARTTSNTIGKQVS